MNIKEILANMTALENEVKALQNSNNALQEKVTAIDHRIDNLIVCDGPPIKKQKTTPSVSELIQKFEPQDTQEPIDWIVKGTEAVNATTCITEGYKCSVINTWNKAMEGQAENIDITEVWKHLLAWCNAIADDDHRKTKMGELKTVFKYMDMEYDSDFTMEHDKLTNKLKHTLEYKQLTPAQLEKYKCSDGAYLTLQKLRAFYLSLPDTISDYHRMQLAFVIYHGNRGQDWESRYGKDNADEHGHYDPETATMHVTKRKTDAIKENGHIIGYKTRTFKVHPEVEKAIARFHAGKTSTWLVPQEKDATKCCKCMCKNIQRQFFCGPEKSKWSEEKPNPYGFPLKINLTDFRHLYETHIRYVDPMPKEELLATMHTIGHSNATAIKRYSEMFRLMHGAKQE